MIIQFNIHYVTQWGQSLYILLHNTKQSLDNSSQGIVMQCNEKFEWTAEISISTDTTTLSYQYAILNSDKSFDYEYGKIRHLDLLKDQNSVFVQDFWRGPFGDSPFTSAAFTDCFFKRAKIKSSVINNNSKLINYIRFLIS